MAPDGTNSDGRAHLLRNGRQQFPIRAGTEVKGKQSWTRHINPLVSRRPWRLFEWCDLAIVPPFVRKRCQNVLTAEWSHRLPMLQKASPADKAASLIARALQRLDKMDDSKLSVVDFCSGGGGPTPTIEKSVNQKRAAMGKPAIPFLLTDLHPHLDAWMKVVAKSSNLSFVPQSVDATNPPIAVISKTSQANDPSAEFSSDTMIFRLYCLAFHHFNDNLARKTLKSTLETADGFAIIELQDRRVASLLLMLLDFFFMFPVTICWFWKDPLHLILTYIIPILPFILSFDGFISSLRTREFEEVLELLGNEGSTDSKTEVHAHFDEEGRCIKTAKKGGWVFEGGRDQHTWPLGYITWVIGHREA